MSEDTTAGGRRRAPTARLSRMGFGSGEQAAERLRHIGEVPSEVVDEVSRAADPDLALAGLTSTAAQMEPGELAALLASDRGLTQRLAAVLGASDALGDYLARHPEYVTDLATDSFSRTPRDQEAFASVLEPAADPDQLRVAYHRQLLSVAARDLTGLSTFGESIAELSDLAAATLGAALAIARTQVAGSDLCRLAVIAMGKCGGRELNYVSDVDVVFVYEPDGDDADRTDGAAGLRTATRLAAAMMRICSGHTAEGRIWEVDAGLRPEGRRGPLVRTLASHVTYYERWAKTWEFQALMKARPVAGDAELGRAYVEALMPMVWEASTRENFVADVRAMRRRVADTAGERTDRELKLGPGGLRDVEFAVQLLQLVHGRGDERLRGAATLSALQALTDGGYVGRDDGAAMGEAYRFLRTLEHRIQLFALRRTHTVPDVPEDLRRLGRGLGLVNNPVDRLEKQWRLHRREVRRLHQKLFYRPLLEAVAALPGEGLRLTADAARQRLTALGFADPQGALSHLQALTSGVSRRAAIQRSLLPAMLSWFAEGPDPDAGLLAFRKVSEGLGATHWYLRKLRDEDEGAEQLAHLLSSSSYVTGLILRAPESVAILGRDDELRPRPRERLVGEMTSAGQRHDDATDAVRAVRRIRRRELSRVGMADALGRLDILDAGRSLSDVAVATLSASLGAVVSSVEADRGEPLPTRVAIVLMGRLGGHEVGYGSDADVMFVHDPLPGVEDAHATSAATAVAQELRRTLALPGDDPALTVDADLRPEGRSGPLVRTLASYEKYYARWSAVWESQALLRADPAIGDPWLCESFTDLIGALRWPEGGLSEYQQTEVRRVKARVEAERLPRGANPASHLKLGRGGLADVEWTVQLLQLMHAHAVPGMRTTETLPALEAAAAAGLVEPSDADALADSWRMVSRIRNAVMLMRSRPAESMVQGARDRAGVAYLLGYAEDETERMVDDYLRVTRLARNVVERVFWA